RREVAIRSKGAADDDAQACLAQRLFQRSSVDQRRILDGNLDQVEAHVAHVWQQPQIPFRGKGGSPDKGIGAELHGCLPPSGVAAPGRRRHPSYFLLAVQLFYWLFSLTFCPFSADSRAAGR